VLSATRNQNCSLENRQKSSQIWGDFLRFFFFRFSIAESTKKYFYHQNNVRNVFSNIELHCWQRSPHGIFKLFIQNTKRSIMKKI